MREQKNPAGAVHSDIMNTKVQPDEEQPGRTGKKQKFSLWRQVTDRTFDQISTDLVTKELT
jgi:hypothetical protein